MSMKRWTDAKIEALKAKPDRVELSVGRGLYIVVEPTKAKSWRYRYKVNGRTEKITLGYYPEVGLADAEELRNAKEREARAARKGLGPTPARRARVALAEALAAPTVSDLADEWIKRKGGEKTKAKRRHGFDKDIKPQIGDMKVQHVTRQHCKKVIDKVLDRGKLGQANEIHKILRGLFRYAIAEGYIENSPMEGRPLPKKYVPKDRHLSDIEITALFDAVGVSDISTASRLCMELLFLTGARPTEAREARWSEIDSKRKLWTIPAERVKNKKAHKVYLSDAAMDVLERADDIKQAGDDPLLFPGTKENAPLSVLALTKALYRLRPRMESTLRKATENPDMKLEPFTLHDLRRTAASVVTSLGYSRFTAGLLLNHTDRSVTSIYDRHDYQAEMRRAWQALGERIIALASGNAANVVPLQRRQEAD